MQAFIINFTMFCNALMVFSTSQLKVVVAMLCCCEFANQRIPLVTGRYFVALCCGFGHEIFSRGVTYTHTFQFHHSTAGSATMRTTDNRYPDTIDLCGHLLAIVDKSYSFSSIKFAKKNPFTRFHASSCVRMVCAYRI